MVAGAAAAPGLRLAVRHSRATLTRDLMLSIYRIIMADRAVVSSLFPRITILANGARFRGRSAPRVSAGWHPPCHAAADLCESVWRRRMAPALSATFMVGRVLRHYVKEERRIPVLEVLVRFLNDDITKTEVHTCYRALSPPGCRRCHRTPPPPLPKMCLLTPAPARAKPQP